MNAKSMIASMMTVNPRTGIKKKSAFKTFESGNVLDALHRRMSGQSGRVIAISVDRDRDRVARFLEENDLSLPVFVDGPEGLIKKLDLDYLPYTFVLDASGQIVFQGNAAKSKKWAEMTGVVDRLLAKAATTRPMERAEKAGS